MRHEIQSLTGFGQTETHLYDDGMGELVDRVLAADGWADGSHYRSKSFVGRKFSSFRQVKAATETAWDEGLKVVEKMIADLQGADLPAPKSRKRRQQWNDDHGDEVCFDRLRAGQEFWRRSVRQTTSGPSTVTILCDVGANCSKRHKDILWRGAAAVALTNILEEAGYRVEFWGAWISRDAYTTGGGRSFLTATKIKACDQPLDISSLTNMVSGWFFRTMLFADCRASLHKLTPCGSLGVSKDIGKYPEVIDLITPDANKITISGVWNYKDAVAFAKQQLEQFISRTEGQACHV